MDTVNGFKTGLPILSYNVLRQAETERSTGHVVAFGHDSWVIAFTGIRGSGKSLCMAWNIAHCLVQHMNVWSNMNVAFKCKYPDGTFESFASKPLDFNALYNLDRELQSGVVAIDEIQYYIDSRVSGSLRNRMINAVIRQIRKRTLSFLYTTRSLDFIDKRLRNWETDIEFQCWDLHKSNTSIGKGKLITINALDHSGAWTGRPWFPKMPPTNRFILKGADRIWPVYNTEEIIDYFEASAPLKMNRGGSGDPGADEAAISQMDSIHDLVAAYRLENQKEVPADQLRANLHQKYGVYVEDRALGKMMKGIGATRKRTHAGSFYVLDKVKVKT